MGSVTSSAGKFFRRVPVPARVVANGQVTVRAVNFWAARAGVFRRQEVSDGKKQMDSGTMARMLNAIFLSYQFLGHINRLYVTHEQLLDAIAVVESCNGKTSNNVYQLSPVYVKDVCRIRGVQISHAQAIGDDELARWVILSYWCYYGAQYERKTGRMPDAQVLARIHNGGPDGWAKKSTYRYWMRVKKELVKIAR